MTAALEKTKALKRIDLSLDDLEPNDQNPNEMSDPEFNMLVDNIEKTGLTDAILVRKKPADQVTAERPAHYRIVGGHHRWEVAKLLGFEVGPCTVIDDPEFDDDAEKFQLVRMNVIHGRMSPKKFMDLYVSLGDKYSAEVAKELFGFAEEEEFKKLVNQMAKSLPSDLQKDFKKAAEEIKTIDGLSKLLNSLFTKYGNTLPYGYMCFDFGGKDSVWLRMTNDTRKALLTIGKFCVHEQRTMDDIIGGLIKLASQDKLKDVMKQLVEDSYPVVIDSSMDLPTAEALGLQ